MPRKDPEARREYQRRYHLRDYEKNKARYKEVAIAHRKKRLTELKEHYAAIKEAAPCSDCGQYYPSYVMEWDHVAGVKRYNVSKMVLNAFSQKMIDAEIAKCELVCSNCHRERTYRRFWDHSGVEQAG